MDFFGFLGESSSSENFFAHPDIQRCPFLQNINEPTKFSLSSSIKLPSSGRGGKGPIFEDGPGFEAAFKLFHGRDGVIPLTGKSFTDDEIVEPEPTPQFNPLAAKAASISLSSFGPGGPFSFDFFNKKFKKLNKKSSKQDRSSQKKGNSSSHEALSNEWLETGQCPIAKSYRAMSNVVPFVPHLAKALQKGVKVRCPPAIVAARAALARTALVKNLRPQPLHEKILAIGALGMAANVPLGVWREHTEKFSPQWFVAIHASVPFIAMLRKSVLMPKRAMAFTIAASVIGQVIGSRAERLRLKAAAEKDGGMRGNLASLKKSGNCGGEVEGMSSSTMVVTGPRPSVCV